MLIQQKFTSTLFSAWRTWNEQRKCEEMVSAVQRGQKNVAWQRLKWAPLFGHGWVERQCMQKSVRQAFHTFWIKRIFFGQPESGEWPKDTVQKQLKGLAANFFDKGITKLAPQHDKWLHLHGNWCSSSFIQAPTGCNKEIFLNNSLNTLYTHSVLLSGHAT